MITVTYHRNLNRVNIQGHAQSAEPGKDLVCAGCSILAHTLAADLQHLKELEYAAEVAVDLTPGDAQISCRPRPRCRAIVEQTMANVCVGFEIMAKKSPEYISYEICG